MTQLRGFVFFDELVVDIFDAERKYIVLDVFILSEQWPKHFIFLVVGIGGFLWTLLKHNCSGLLLVNNIALLSEVSALLLLFALFIVTCLDTASLKITFLGGVGLEFHIFVLLELYCWSWIFDAADIVWV